jgi:hypothetical protein
MHLSWKKKLLLLPLMPLLLKESGVRSHDMLHMPTSFGIALHEYLEVGCFARWPKVPQSSLRINTFESIQKKVRKLTQGMPIAAFDGICTSKKISTRNCFG